MSAKTTDGFGLPDHKFRGRSPCYNSLKKLNTNLLLENTQRSSETRSVSFAHDMSVKTTDGFGLPDHKFRGCSPRYNSLRKLNTNHSSRNTQRSSEIRSVGFAHDMSAKIMNGFKLSGSKFRGRSPRYNSPFRQPYPRPPTPFRRPFFPLP